MNLGQQIPLKQEQHDLLKNDFDGLLCRFVMMMRSLYCALKQAWWNLRCIFTGHSNLDSKT
jgi:hypothetical protein